MLINATAPTTWHDGKSIHAHTCGLSMCSAAECVTARVNKHKATSVKACDQQSSALPLAFLALQVTAGHPPSHTAAAAAAAGTAPNLPGQLVPDAEGLLNLLVGNGAEVRGRELVGAALHETSVLFGSDETHVFSDNIAPKNASRKPCCRPYPYQKGLAGVQLSYQKGLAGVAAFLICRCSCR